MKAAWQLSTMTAAERRERLALAAECGFDTMIVPDSTPETTERADELGLDVLAIVGAYPSAEFRESHPDAVQRVHPVEEALEELLAERAPANYQRLSHRRYPVVHSHSAFCFEHPASVDALEARVAEALSIADGVAFDGFGYRNRYACFCDRCRELRERRAAADEEPAAVLGRTAEQTLVDVSETLYDRAKAIDPDAVVTNHVWPPFRPNPSYGHRLKLDYCGQTVSWFYPPSWRVQRVEFEAATHERLAKSGRNEFVPFVGLKEAPSLRRPPSRLRRELEIARRYGGENIVLATLEPLAADDDLRAVVRDALA